MRQLAFPTSLLIGDAAIYLGYRFLASSVAALSLRSQAAFAMILSALALRQFAISYAR